MPTVVVLCIAAAFKAWMLFDALRRRAPALWYVVLVVPFGDIVYFFAVKLRDFNVREAPPVPEPDASVAQVSLAALEQEVELSPSFHNRVRAGWALLEHGEPERAEPYFEAALRTHPNDKEGLYGLGLSRFERGDHAGAIE